MDSDIKRLFGRSWAPFVATCHKHEIKTRRAPLLAGQCLAQEEYTAAPEY